MADLEDRIPDPLADSGEEEVEDDASPSALRSFMGLFVVPLFVVLASVGVFIGFGWIAYDQSTATDYVDDLSHWSRPRRSQAAYELAKVLIADPTALDEQPELSARVRQLFEEGDDEEIRRYLILVLGHTRDRQAVPLLVEEARTGGPESRIYAIWALGTIGHPSALEPLRTALAEDDAGLRKTAAFSLGQLGQPEAAPALRVALDDPVADVRWNAALALARLGSDAGVEVLQRMLDRGLAAQVPGITPEQQEDAMIEAVKGLAVVGGSSGESLLRELSKADPSLKVRQAALDALRVLKGASEASEQG